MSEFKTIDVVPQSNAVGAEIRGIDLAGNVDDSQFGEIKAAYDKYGVIFFHDQKLRPEDQIAFAERWGKININRFFATVDGYPMIAKVLKEPDQKKNIGGGWHTDHSYDQIPAMGSVLYALETPKVGGDTMFASMERAYETLSDGLKKTLSGLNACHSSRHVFGANRSDNKDAVTDERISNAELATQDAVHPVVLTHPRTGRKLLYINPGFTTHFEGWTEEESKPLMNYLYEHAARPEHTYRFSWGNGSIAFWDNLATWHRAVNDYHGERRLMHRITIDGDSLN